MVAGHPVLPPLTVASTVRKALSGIVSVHQSPPMSDDRKYRQRGYQDDDRDRQKPRQESQRPEREPGAPAGARRISSEGARNPRMMGSRQVARC